MAYVVESITTECIECGNQKIVHMGESLDPLKWVDRCCSKPSLVFHDGQVANE